MTVRATGDLLRGTGFQDRRDGKAAGATVSCTAKDALVSH